MAGEVELNALLTLVQNALEGKRIDNVSWDPLNQRFTIGLNTRVTFFVGIEDMIISIMEA